MIGNETIHTKKFPNPNIQHCKRLFCYVMFFGGVGMSGTWEGGVKEQKETAKPSVMTLRRKGAWEQRDGWGVGIVFCSAEAFSIRIFDSDFTRPVTCCLPRPLFWPLFCFPQVGPTRLHLMMTLMTLSCLCFLSSMLGYFPLACFLCCFSTLQTSLHINTNRINDRNLPMQSYRLQWPSFM